MEKTLLWKASFDRKMQILSTSQLQLDTRFSTMFLFLEKYQELQSDESLSNPSRKININLSENSSMVSFVLTLSKMLVELTKLTEKEKKEESLRKVYRWFKDNRKNYIGLEENVNKNPANFVQSNSITSYNKSVGFKIQDSKFDDNDLEMKLNPHERRSFRIALPYIKSSIQRNRAHTVPYLSITGINSEMSACLKNDKDTLLLGNGVAAHSSATQQDGMPAYKHDKATTQDGIPAYKHYKATTQDGIPADKNDTVTDKGQILINLKKKSKKHLNHLRSQSSDDILLSRRKNDKILVRNGKVTGIENKSTSLKWGDIRTQSTVNRSKHPLNIHLKTLASAMVVKHLSEKEHRKSENDGNGVPAEEIVRPRSVFTKEYLKVSRRMYDNDNEESPIKASCSFSTEELQSMVKKAINVKSNNFHPMKTKGQKLQLSQRPKKTSKKITSETKLQSSNKTKVKEDVDDLDKESLNQSNIHNNNQDDSTHSKLSTNMNADTSILNHLCYDGEIELEAAQKYRINAAVNIQRIFRGHCVRKYLQQIRNSSNEKKKKRQSAYLFAQRNYQEHVTRMKNNLLSRDTSEFNNAQWSKSYQKKLKEKETERFYKMKDEKKKQTKHESKVKEIITTKTASTNIHEIFKNKTPTKAQKKTAAIKIQKVVRGWRVRLHMKRCRDKVEKRSLSFESFVQNTYVAHINKIVENHGGEQVDVYLNFDEVLEYVNRRNKYEYEFIGLAENDMLRYESLVMLFENCQHFPSMKEINDAVKIILKKKGVKSIENHDYSKQDVVDLAFHIYPPKGAHIQANRKSTWLHPLIQGEEAKKYQKKKKGVNVSYEQCAAVVATSMRINNSKFK